MQRAGNLTVSVQVRAGALRRTVGSLKFVFVSSLGEEEGEGREGRMTVSPPKLLALISHAVFA